MKVWLPFNPKTHLQGTGIAESLGLRIDHDKDRTLFEGSERDAADLLKLLVAFQEELAEREQRQSKRETRSPLGTARRSEIRLQLAAVVASEKALRQQLAGQQSGSSQSRQ